MADILKLIEKIDKEDAKSSHILEILANRRFFAISVDSNENRQFHVYKMNDEEIMYSLEQMKYELLK